jgi:hypothetical protein
MWHEPGFPTRHHDEIRRADRYAMVAIGGTAMLSVLLLLGTMYWHVPPALAACAVAVFLVFGLLGGLSGVYDTRRHVRVIPYFRRSVGGIDTYTAGQSLARYLSQLDAVANANGVTPLSAFGFNDDLRGEPLTWHIPADGLQTVTTILKSLEQSTEHKTVPADAASQTPSGWLRLHLRPGRSAADCGRRV